MSESLSRAEIARVVNEAVGAPSSGAVAEVLDDIVDAVDAALNPAPAKQEKRVIEADEKR